MRLTPRQLRIFVSLAHSLNFSRTAGQFHLTQPSLSKIVREIEAEFGVRLFDRTTRSVALTADGSAFLGVATRLIGDYELGIAELEEVARQRAQRVAIAALPTLAAMLAGPISALRARRPDVSIKVHDVPADAALELLRARKVDFALTTTDPAFEDLAYEEILRDRFVLVSARGSPIPLRDRVWAEASLNELPLITMPRGSSTRQYIDAAFLRSNMQFRPSLELSGLATIAAFVRAGCGIALLPQLGARLIQDDRLTVTRLAGAPERPLGIVTRQAEIPSPLSTELIAALRRLAAEWESEDPGDDARRAPQPGKRRPRAADR